MDAVWYWIFAVVPTCPDNIKHHDFCNNQRDLECFHQCQDSTKPTLFENIPFVCLCLFPFSWCLGESKPFDDLLAFAICSLKLKNKYFCKMRGRASRNVSVVFCHGLNTSHTKTEMWGFNFIFQMVKNENLESTCKVEAESSEKKRKN